MYLERFYSIVISSFPRAILVDIGIVFASPRSLNPFGIVGVVDLIIHHIVETLLALANRIHFSVVDSNSKLLTVYLASGIKVPL